MEMKKVLTAAVAFVLFLAGCSRTEGENPAAVSGTPGRTEKAEEVQAPYYYGLIEEYRMTLAQDPHNLAAVIALGNAYYDSGQWKEAITLYDRALRIDPRNADVRADMGTSYRNIGMSDRALAEYRKALEYEPGHLNSRYNIGVVYAYDKKDYAAAVHVWENLLQLSPHHPQSEHMRSCIVTFKKVLKKDGP
jgi:tetratricopeptide (TPR) repeat protein